MVWSKQEWHEAIARLEAPAGTHIVNVQHEPEIPMVAVSSLGASPARHMWHDGEKFPGGFGPTNLLTTDYWTLRARSSQLFRTNIYARGIIRRLVTNIINVGLHLEAVPDETILGRSEDDLADWAEHIENRFHLWERSPHLCDFTGQSTFGSLQKIAKAEAIISGDVLVTLRQERATGLPQVRLISGSAVQSPVMDRNALKRGHRIHHGVELDASGRHVAYWIRKDDRKAERLPAYGPSGRKLAWLVYGTDKRLDDVRGEPILSLVLQSLNEIDRYRDSVQRKATVNAMLAMFIKREQAGPAARALTAGGGPMLKSEAMGASTDTGSSSRRFNVVEHIPGLALDMLAPGEEPHGFPPNGTDEKFGEFEAAIVYAVAWALEIPPEILTLSFKNNYSASQAAVNEFKNYLNPVRADWGEAFCQPIYVDWLLSEALNQRIEAPGLLESWRDPLRYDEFAAWVAADWCGAIKPSVDVVKQARGYGMLTDRGWITNDRASRETTGTKWSKNIKKLKRENELWVEAMRPRLEMEQQLRQTSQSLSDPQTERDPGASAVVLHLAERMSEAEDRLGDLEEEKVAE